MVTESVGPFKATGYKPFLAVLRELHRAIRETEPSLYDVLGTAGVLCVRHVRGNPHIASNHCFGMAIDYTIGGRLDIRGDGFCQRGLVRIYEIAKSIHSDLFWGCGYGTEDAMHLEASYRLCDRWGLI